MGKKGYAVEGNTITNLDTGAELGGWPGGRIVNQFHNMRHSHQLSDNPSGISPTEFKVLVRPDATEEKTKGGIILPDDTKEKAQYAAQKATLIAVSPAAFSYDEDVRKNAPRPGERVLVAKYSGFEVEGSDGVKYRVVADKDICAILT